MKTLPVLAVGAALLAAFPVLAAEFRVTSPDIADGKTLAEAQVFSGFGCSGKNLSPALSWENVPAGTKSFAITAYDPDAPTGSGWWHWVAFNIPASTKGVSGGAGDPSKALLPAGTVQGRTDFGTPGYGGACPPEGHGVHHYVFTVFALKAESLPLDAQASPAMVGFNLNANVLAKASITAVYGR